jgi:hypothetical protein
MILATTQGNNHPKKEKEKEKNKQTNKQPRKRKNCKKFSGVRDFQHFKLKYPNQVENRLNEEAMLGM